MSAYKQVKIKTGRKHTVGSNVMKYNNVIEGLMVETILFAHFFASVINVATIAFCDIC